MDPNKIITLRENGDITLPPQELIETVTSFDLEEGSSTLIVSRFTPFFASFSDLKQASDAIVVSDVSHKKEMAEAKALRQQIVKIRTGAEKTKDDLKEDSKRYANAVQSAYNFIKASCEAIEASLKEKEEFAARQEEAQRRILVETRTALIEPYKDLFPSAIDLGTLREEDFVNMLNATQLLSESRKREAELKAIAEAEEAKREEEARKAALIEAQEKARQEAEARRKAEEELAKARAEAEAKAREEARIKAEAEERERQRTIAEEKAKKEAEKKARLAPDKDKLNACLSEMREFAKNIGAVQLQSEEYKALQKYLVDGIATLADSVSNEIAK